MATTIASLVFAGPAWVAGLVAIALPVLAHLWHRRTGPPTPFTNVAMVERVERHAARRDRWRDLLLLAMRCAIVALIVAAFMRPGWSASASHDAAPVTAVGRGAAGIIVLDASASMRRSAGGRTLFDRARDRAIDITNQHIAAGGAVAVIVAGRTPDPVVPQPTTLAAAATRALRNARCTLDRADLTEAASLAFAIALRHHAAGTVVHVLTDDQSASWSADTLSPPADVSVRFDPIDSAAAAPQLALAGAAAAGPAPVVGEPTVITARVLNATPDAATAVVAMTCDGAADTRTVDVPAHGSATVSFVLRFDAPGPRVVRLSLPDDAFRLDNHAAVLLSVRPAVNVWLHTNDDVNDDTTAAYYLARAIAPTAGRYRLRVIDTLPQPDDRPRPDVLVIASTNALRVDDGPILDDWQARGVGVLRFIEPRARGGELSSLVPADPDHAVWRAFDAPALATLMRGTLTVGRLAFDPLTFDTLAESTDGRPVIVARITTRRRDVVVNASVAPADGDLVRSPAYPGLIHQLLRCVEPRSAAAPPTCAGERVTIALPPGTAVDRIVGPTGDAIPFTPRTGVDADAVDATAPPQPGGYAAVDTANRTLGGFVVGFDTRESDLTVGRPTIAAGPGVLEAAAPAADSPAARADARPLWPWCIVAALLLGVGELVVAHLTRRAVDASRRPAPMERAA